jgi:hypothetical protein
MNILNENFTLTLIRDIDYSFLLNLNDSIIIYIIEYPTAKYYYQCNNNNILDDKIKIIKNFEVIFNNIEELEYNTMFKKGIFSKKLDDNNQLKINFTIFYRDEQNDYIVSNPYISGLKKIFD